MDNNELKVYQDGIIKDAKLNAPDETIKLASGKDLLLFYNEQCADGQVKRQTEPYFVLVLPGGGYEFTSYREANVVAKAFVKEGFAAGVLNYSTKTLQEVALSGQGLAYKALEDVALAIDELRHNSSLPFTHYKIVLCGFSAGGHLAASMCTKYDDETLLKSHPWRGSLRPDGAILGYAVISSDQEITHHGTFTVLTGAPEQGEWDKWSCDKLVNEHTPPAFIWHTATDESVSYQNSLRYAQAMWDCGNKAMLTIYPSGRHGSSIAKKEVEFDNNFALANSLNALWLPAACQFVRQNI